MDEGGRYDAMTKMNVSGGGVRGVSGVLVRARRVTEGVIAVVEVSPTTTMTMTSPCLYVSQE